MNRFWYSIMIAAFILSAPAANAGLDPIGWTLTGGVPAQTFVNELFSGTYTLVNNLPFTMPTPLIIGKKIKGEYTVVDNCSGLKLAPHQTCTVSFTLTPSSAGKKSLTILMEYDNNIVPLKTKTTSTLSTSPLVTGTVTTPLPAAIGTGTPASPVAFRFTNDTNGTVYAISYTANYPAGFTETSNSCNTISTLGPGASCSVTGNLVAATPGSYTVGATLNYNGGSTALSTSTTASILVIGTVTQPLPATTGTGAPTPFQFTFTNTGSTDASGVTPPTIVSDPGFTVATNTCATITTLPAHESCIISGSLNAATPGIYRITATFHYNGGDVPVSTATTADMLVTATASTPLPATIGTGSPTPVVFSFTNTGNETVVGVVAPTIGVSGGTFNNFATTCGSTLGPGDTCTASGDFTASTTGSFTVTGTFTYSGGSVSATTSTNASVLVTGAATTPLPTSIGTGSPTPFALTFTNNGSATVVGVTPPTIASDPGFTVTTNTCSSISSLGSGSSCVISGSLTAATAGTFSITATFHYTGGNVSASTSTTASQLVTGAATTAFPATIGTGAPTSFVLTFTNTGSASISGITAPTVTFSPSATGFTVTSNTCNAITTLGPGSSCAISGSLTAATAGGYSVSATFHYDGPDVSTSTSTTASQMVTGTATTPLPAIIPLNTATPFALTFTNTGSATVVGVTPPTVTASSPDFSVTSNSCNSITTLAAGASCSVSGSLDATVAGAYSISATFHYSGPDVTTSTSTVAAFAATKVDAHHGRSPKPSDPRLAPKSSRVFTIANHCTADVWFSFNGGRVQDKCATDRDCPIGSQCNPKANAGLGACYWKNPTPVNNELRLKSGDSTTVLVSDVNSALNTIWTGVIAGRTGCLGDSTCETADCDSGGGSKSCPPGKAFKTPVTEAQFTLIRDAADIYRVQAIHGVNLPVSIGPTMTASPAGQPYVCGNPGSAVPNNPLLGSCTWDFNPPNNDYIWVKAKSSSKACKVNSDCPISGEVCGLSYDARQRPSFQKTCGRKIGYFTAHAACELNAIDADPFFGCNRTLVKHEDTKLLNIYRCAATNTSPLMSCYDANANASCCGCINWDQAPANLLVPTTGTFTQACVNQNPTWKLTVLNTIQWIKIACPTLSTYLFDTASSTFTCNTPVKNINVTNYTVTFCPT